MKERAGEKLRQMNGEYLCLKNSFRTNPLALPPCGNRDYGIVSCPCPFWHRVQNLPGLLYN